MIYELRCITCGEKKEEKEVDEKTLAAFEDKKYFTKTPHLVELCKKCGLPSLAWKAVRKI